MPGIAPSWASSRRQIRQSLYLRNTARGRPQRLQRVYACTLCFGARVTLRGARMYEFLDRLVSIALPRIRDFRGLNPDSFDGRGNYSLGIKEQIIFPEIDYDSVPAIRGLDIAITTTAENDEQARALLRALGLPFATERRDS